MCIVNGSCISNSNGSMSGGYTVDGYWYGYMPPPALRVLGRPESPVSLIRVQAFIRTHGAVATSFCGVDSRFLDWDAEDDESGPWRPSDPANKASCHSVAVVG